MLTVINRQIDVWPKFIVKCGSPFLWPPGVWVSSVLHWPGPAGGLAHTKQTSRPMTLTSRCCQLLSWWLLCSLALAQVPSHSLWWQSDNCLRVKLFFRLITYSLCVLILYMKVVNYWLKTAATIPEDTSFCKVSDYLFVACLDSTHGSTELANHSYMLKVLNLNPIRH